MPRPLCPSSVNRLPVNAMWSAAETWTAEGIWSQWGRVASKSGQPLWHEVSAPDGRSQVPEMYAPVCWLA